MNAQLFGAVHLSKARQFRESQRLLDQAIGGVPSAPASDASLAAQISELYQWRGIMFERSGRTPKRLPISRKTKNCEITPAVERDAKAMQMAKSIAASDTDDLESRLQIAKLHDTIGVVRAQIRRT